VTMDYGADPALVASQSSHSSVSRPSGFDPGELEAEILRLTDALAFAHSEGFEWPADPLPINSIAWRLRIQRGNERISEQ
jgi:hypothetical protein